MLHSRETRHLARLSVNKQGNSLLEYLRRVKGSEWCPLNTQRLEPKTAIGKFALEIPIWNAHIGRLTLQGNVNRPKRNQFDSLSKLRILSKSNCPGDEFTNFKLTNSASRLDDRFRWCHKQTFSWTLSTNCKIGLTMKFIRYLESLVLKKTHYMIPAR